MTTQPHPSIYPLRFGRLRLNGGNAQVAYGQHIYYTHDKRFVFSLEEGRWRVYNTVVSFGTVPNSVKNSGIFTAHFSTRKQAIDALSTVLNAE